MGGLGLTWGYAQFRFKRPDGSNGVAFFLVAVKAGGGAATGDATIGISYPATSRGTTTCRLHAIRRGVKFCC